MDENYKGHHVQAQPTLNPDTNRWTPKVTVRWDEYGKTMIHNLYGPIDHSGSKQDAENEAIQMGRKWIDDGKPV